MSDTATANGRKSAEAFTLIELLVVVAVIATLAALLLPMWANARRHSVNVQCLSNIRQLVLGWHMYASDNNDILAPNDYPYETQFALETLAVQKQQFNWVCGTMEQPIDSEGGLSGQVSELLNPVGTALANYVKNPRIYHCPADNYVDPNSHNLHVRSVSMNSAIGTLWRSSSSEQGGAGAPPLGSAVEGGWLNGSSYNSSQTNWLTYGRMSSFTRPGPANTWVIIDENPYSINDASFAASASAITGGTYLVDFASSNHNNGAGLAFVDGHAVIHQWLDSRTYSPQKFGVGAGLGSTGSFKQTPDNQDCFYLAPLTSAPR